MVSDSKGQDTNFVDDPCRALLAGPWRIEWEDGRCWIKNAHGRRLAEVKEDGMFANYAGDRGLVAETIVEAVNRA